MRILWITHDIFEPFLPYVKGKPTKGSSWVAPLFYNMKIQSGVKLGSITPVTNGEAQKKEIDGITYYSIRIKKNENIRNISKKLVARYRWAINDFQPDIIHIHGTERNFGLLRKFVDAKIPIVCSIQGILLPCYDGLKYSIAGIGMKKYQSLKNWLGRGGVYFSLRRWKSSIPIEQEIFRINKYFIGRTKWDKAHLKAMNPSAVYFHGEELLRDEFYTQKWHIDTCERHRIFISSAGYSLKGAHVLLKAAAILKSEYPNLKIVAPLTKMDMHSSYVKDYLTNEDYANYLKSLIRKYSLENNVVFEKRFSAMEMAIENSKAHVFVLASFIENSPNALGESMMVGVPSVASMVGGVASMVKDNESSLLFPAGDHVLLAYQIKRVFSDDTLAIKLSREAQITARKRHDIELTTRQYLTIYSNIIEQQYE